MYSVTGCLLLVFLLFLMYVLFSLKLMLKSSRIGTIYSLFLNAYDYYNKKMLEIINLGSTSYF